MTFIIIFIFSLAIALLATYLTQKMATKHSIGTYPDGRMVHLGFIPHMGGIGFITGFAGGILLLFGLNEKLFFEIISGYGAILAGSLLIVILGIYDDLKGLNAAKKFTGQFIAASIVIFLGCKIDILVFPSGHSIHLGIMAVPFTYLWFIGVSNAVNLLDGLDGLAAGAGIIASSAIALIAWQSADYATFVVTLSLIAGLLGFLKFNHHPASIFMGDTGSLFLGFILAAISIRGFESQPGNISLLIPSIALAVPISDTSLAFFRRLNGGRHPFKADKDHLHHRLIFLGLTHRQAVYIIYGISILSAVTAFTVATQSLIASVVMFTVTFTLSVLGLKRLGYLEAQKSKTYYGDEKIIRAKHQIAPLSMRRIQHRLSIGISDVFMVNIALIVTWWVRFQSGIIKVNRPVALDEFIFTPVTLIITLLWISLFFVNNLYNMYWDVSRFDKVQRVNKTVLFGIVILYLVTLDPSNLFTEGRIAILIYGLCVIFFVNFGRLIVIGFEKRYKLLEYAPHNTLLIGTSEKGKKILKDIRKNPHLLYNIVGYISKNPSEKIFYDLDSLGVYKDIPEIIRKFEIEEVIIAINERSRDEVLNIVSYAENMNVVFKIVPEIYDVVSGHKTEEVIGHPLIRLFPEHMFLWQWILKRIYDVILASAVALIFIPVALLIIFLLFISGNYPPLIIQNMVGRNGRLFGKLNFNVGEKETFVQRLLFKTRLYKVPEIMNVLLGQMSFVGPRPEQQEEVDHLKEKIKFYNRRFQIRPGMTGWAQVKFRYDESLRHKREQFKQDLFYLENMSLTFDFRILLRSSVIFLTNR